MVDEAAEKAEQEVLARREGEMLAMRAAMEREEEQQARLGAEGDGEDEGMGMERDLDLDLDDGVAEAMRPGDEDEDDDDDGEDEEDDDDGDEGVDEEEDEGAGETGTETETETEALEGVEVSPFDTHGAFLFVNSNIFHDKSTNVTSNILDIHDGQEHNLDDDVPSAGSYEHTDTELEDTESLVESSDHILPPSSPAAAAAAAPYSTTSSPASTTQHSRHHPSQAAPPPHTHAYPRAALPSPSHATPESSEYAAATSLVRISASAARQGQARSTQNPAAYTMRNPAPFGLLAHALDGEDANDDSSLLLDGVDSSLMSAGLGLGMSMSSPIAAARRGRTAAAAASADGVGSEAEDALIRPGRWPGANRRAREG